MFAVASGFLMDGPVKSMKLSATERIMLSSPENTSAQTVGETIAIAIVRAGVAIEPMTLTSVARPNCMRRA